MSRPPRLASLALLLSLAAPAWAAPPKASIVAKAAFPSGSTVFVDLSGCASDSPVVVAIAGRENEPILFTEGRTGAVFPALPDGTFTAAVGCVGKDGDAPQKQAIAAVTFTVGGVAPPVPGPDAIKPLPAPASQFQVLGRSYGAAQLKTYADTWAESRTMLAAGIPIKQVTDTSAQRWLDRRTPAYKPVQAAFAAVGPEGVEPTGPARDQLSKAWQDFETGLREAIR